MAQMPQTWHKTTMEPYFKLRDYKDKKDFQDSFQKTNQIEISSVILLSDPIKLSLEKVLTGMIGKPISPRYHIDPSLVAGMSIQIGELIVDTSIKKQMVLVKDIYLQKTKLIWMKKN